MLQKINRIRPRLQGPPGLKGEQGDTVVIDYDGRILDALKVSPTPRPCQRLRVNGRGLKSCRALPRWSCGTVPGPVLRPLPELSVSAQSWPGGKSLLHLGAEDIEDVPAKTLAKLEPVNSGWVPGW